MHAVFYSTGCAPLLQGLRGRGAIALCLLAQFAFGLTVCIQRHLVAGMRMLVWWHFVWTMLINALCTCDSVQMWESVKSSELLWKSILFSALMFLHLLSDQDMHYPWISHDLILKTFRVHCTMFCQCKDSKDQRESQHWDHYPCKDDTHELGGAWANSEWLCEGDWRELGHLGFLSLQ